jgi:thiaminase
MTRAYANHFARRLTLAELNELIAVFSTPTARKYTEAWLGMAQDADFAEVMREMMPQMMETAGRLEERIRAATAHLPPPPSPPPPPPPEADAPEAGPDESAQ